MSMITTANNTFNKSKEDLIWFVKKAVQDKKSHFNAENKKFIKESITSSYHY